MAMSNRARRMLQHQLRHRADASLNLIPMIDILTVMVAFLLVYSANVEVVQNTKAIQIPQSISQQLPRQTLVAMVTPDELYLQGEPIESVADIRAANSTILQPLRTRLQRPMLVASNGNRPEDVASREVTIMADKALPYEVLKKIMSTFTDANYGRISLAVMQKDKPVPVAGAPAS
jgi:biopolymer transport protein ExbD